VNDSTAETRRTTWQMMVLAETCVSKEEDTSVVLMVGRTPCSSIVAS
jgi:hypothetical protein